MDFSTHVVLISTVLQGFLCEEWSAWYPRSVTALRGHCVVIPCTFTYPGRRRGDNEFDIAWYYYRKAGYPTVYHRNHPKNVIDYFKGRTYPYGNPGEKECSLVIDGIKEEDEMDYYVWIDPGTVKYNFYERTVNVKLTDNFPDPYIENFPEFIEGTPVNIKCTIVHTCPFHSPRLRWTISGNVQEGNTKYTENSWKYSSVLRFTPSSAQHGQHLQCHCDSPRTRASNYKTIYVKQKPVILSNSICNFQQAYVSCTCMARGYPLPTAVWTVGDQTISSSNGVFTVSSSSSDMSSTSTLNGKLESEKKIICTMKNSYMSTSSTLHNPGTYKPIISEDSSCSFTQASVSCQCMAIANPMPTSYWMVVDKKITQSGQGFSVSSTTSWNKYTTILTGQLDTEVTITCVMTNSHGTRSSQIVTPATYKPVISLDSSCNLTQYNVSCQCAATANPLPTAVWMVGDQKITESGKGFSVSTSRSWKKYMTSLTGQLEFEVNITCVMNNRHGSSSLQLISPATYISAILPESNCTFFEGNVTCKCLVSAYPLPAAIWTVGDQNIARTDQDFSVSSVISWKKYASILMGKMDFDVNITCIMSNTGGNSSLQLYSASTFEPTILPESNCTYNETNVICQCVANANPLPKADWIVGGQNITNHGQVFSVSSVISWQRFTSILEGKMDSEVSIACVMTNIHGSTELQLYTVDNMYLLIWVCIAVSGLIITVIFAAVLCKLHKKKNYTETSSTPAYKYAANEEKMDSDMVYENTESKESETKRKIPKKVSNLYEEKKLDYLYEEASDIYQNDSFYPQTEPCDVYESNMDFYKEQEDLYANYE
ncbi:myelin-associated glycoprotein-like [Protopterus annectens]|uniref:myelin-associated glycoprotein-like n=1 Tax=Protopterus annectens TaxID=7888 RepID=UPI001CFA903B|nr:myelin-associated glycoprotein-like [Protopterus annectens]